MRALQKGGRVLGSEGAELRSAGEFSYTRFGSQQTYTYLLAYLLYVDVVHVFCTSIIIIDTTQPSSQ